MSDDNVERMLKNLISTTGETNYPGRIYGMYEWSNKKNRWDISQEWLLTWRIQKLTTILEKI